MKKLLLLVLVISFGFGVSAQQVRQDIKSYKMNTEQAVANAPVKASTPVQHIVKPATKGGKNIVNIIDLGTSANAYSYGYAGGQKSILSYNADINTVSHIHRMGGELDPDGYSGDLGIDYSIDGGETFTNMVEIYVAENNAGGQYFTDAARYPNHGIYNPAGNTDPANAYVTFAAPALDGTNDGWGGYALGTANLGDPAITTKTLLTSDPSDDIYRYIPDGFTVTNSGDVWIVDVDQDWTSGELVYTGYLLVNHGVWNDAINDFEYTEFLLDCPVEAETNRPAMAKIEFAPDGQTGYIAIIGDNGELEFATGSYFPIIWKTTDGGETWGDPVEVAISGEDGIHSILYYLDDQEWESLWSEPPYPEREEVLFTTAFDFDMTVDGNGNPHIAVGISVSGNDPYSIISANPYYAITDIHSIDGGDNWDAYIIGQPKTFRSSFDEEYTEDSRVQIARNHNGSHIFVSYLDTQMEGEEDNNYPDIMARGIEVATGIMTERDSTGIRLDQPTNVTNLSDAMWQAYFMVMANEVIVDGDNFILPFTYEEMNITNVGDPVQYKYIQDFTFTPDDFTLGVGIEEETAANFAVSQNYPNPFSRQTEIMVTLNQNSDVTVNVFNLMGQNAYHMESNNLTAGTYTYYISASDLEPGVYFYAVTAGNKTISKKMIIE